MFTYKIFALVGGILICALITYAVISLHTNLTLKGREKEKESGNE